MQYICLIYSAPGSSPTPGTPEFGAYMQAYMDFTEEAKQKGAFVAGDALQSIDTATTVTMQNGKVETTDGPFAETKETLGGYYILDCKDLDEALSYAAKIPSAAFGTIEVRPVMVFE